MRREGLNLATGRLDSSYGEDLIHGTGTLDSCYWRLDSWCREARLMLQRDLIHATGRLDSCYGET